jgi:hypothetical protein
MKRIVPVLLLVLLVGAAASAQPQYGDIVVAVGGSGGGYTGYLSPANPGTLTTLNTIAVAPTGCFHTWVRMARDNTDLVVSEVNLATNPCAGRLLHIQPGGGQTPIATLGSVVSDGYELDHDGWVACARIFPNTTPRQNYLLHVAPGAPAPLTRLWSPLLTVSFNEVAIDRDPVPGTSAPYVVATCCAAGTGPHPMLLRADRRGVFTTVLGNPPSALGNFRCLEVDPRSGDLLLLETTATGPAGLLRMNKACTTVMTLLPALMASALKITQDDSVWIAANQPDRILKYHPVQNAVVATYPLIVPPAYALQGIDVYGSRPLVCNQVSASTVNVNVQSRHPWVQPGTQYALAASFARRPPAPANCLRFPNGEYLCLDVTHPLFFLSALGLLPGVFSNFQGSLTFSNGVGTAAATVNIPQAAQGLGIPIFVAGVIYDQQRGVIEVTNTHWFVL